VRARRSLLCEFGPRRDNVVFSDKTEGGIPTLYTIKLEKWKGNSDGKLEQTLIIHQNRVDINHCPVVSMMMWMKVLDAKCPGENNLLVPALEASHHDFLRDEQSKNMRMCESTWNLWFTKAAAYVGGVLDKIENHDFRRSLFLLPTKTSLCYSIISPKLNTYSANTYR
jgi:hypothetical protein